MGCSDKIATITPYSHNSPSISSQLSKMTPLKLTKLSQVVNNVWKVNKSSSIAAANNKQQAPIVADTGATSHFMDGSQGTKDMIHCNIPVNNIVKVKNGIQVLLPNKQTLQSTHEGTLNIPELPIQARRAHIFPHLASGSLLSIGQLCDAGCSALFDKHKLYIFYNGKIILQGTRQQSKLWTIDKDNHHSLNSVIDAPTIAERIEFYSRSLFSPTLSTLEKAIKAGFLSSFPVVTTKQLRKWPPQPVATTKGHMNAQRANLRSTRQASNNMSLTTLSPNIQTHVIPEDDSSPSSPTTAIAPVSLPKPTTLLHPVTKNNSRTNSVYAACLPMTGEAYSDQTGQFPIPSSAGNKYIFVLYDYDSSYITAIAIPSRTKEQILGAYKSAITMLTKRGFKPQLHRLDNEASTILKEYMHEEDIDFQLTPAGIHRRNKAERAIQTYKNHFIAGLCSVDPAFPLHLWDRLLPQATITLNLLRASRVNPKLSAYAQIHGQFDYNRTPLVPPGTKVLAHERPEDRKSFAPHAVEGFYTGPAMDHYRCYKIWIKSTGRERIVNTIKWLPHNFRMPHPSREALIIAAANDLTKALLSTDENRALPPLHTDTRNALKNLTEIFQNKLPQPTIDKSVQHHPVPEPRVLPTPKPAFTIPAPTPQPKPQNTLPPKSLDHKNPAPTTAPIDCCVTPQKAAPQPRVSTSPTSVPTHPSTPNKTEFLLPFLRNTNNDNLTNSHGQPLRRGKRQRKTNHFITNNYVANAVLNEATGALEEYRHLIQGKDAKHWMKGNAKEIARLCHGRKNGAKGTNTIVFKHPREIPPGRKPTYLRVVASYRPTKEDPFRIRWTVGGNLVCYDGVKYTPNADQTTVKLLLNSVISTKDGRFMCVDLKDFYLNTPLPTPEYMLVPVKMIPQEIMDGNGHVLAQINKSMYGLPQAGRISYDELAKHLAEGIFHRLNLDVKIGRIGQVLLILFMSNSESS